MGTKKTPVEATAPTDPVAEARAAVERLFVAEQELSARRASLAETVSQQTQTAGEALLSAVLAGSDSPAAALAAVRDEIATIDQALALARQQRAEAILAVYRAEGQVLRAEAGQKRAEAEVRLTRRAELLAPLIEFEGCQWQPSGTTGQRVISYANALHYGPAEVEAATLTDKLLIEAQGLEHRATIVEGRRVPAGGEADASTIDELLAQVLSPFQLAPMQYDIRSWAEAGLAAEQARRARWMATDARQGSPIRLYLVWERGAIDPERSHVGMPR